MRRLTVGGRKRSYLAHFPRGFRSDKPMPVVVALHGATMNASMMAWFSGLNKKADQEGFIVAYPNGTGRNFSYTWNAGNCCGFALEKQIDDVGFFHALLDDLVQRFHIDVHRIYVTGMSNGAIMAYRLACEAGDRIAAIAPVSGPLGIEVNEIKRPMPVLHFHGTADQYTPFDGCLKSLSGRELFSVDHSVQTWVRLNGCQAEPLIDVLSKADDEFQVIRKVFPRGRDGTEVVLVVIEGGGHTWPGRKSPVNGLGKSALNISANDLMWEFFQRHRLK